MRDQVIALCARGVDRPLEDAVFDALARRIFAFQFERNGPYAAYCRRRGRTPDDVAHWSEIPAVPTAAFKEVRLVAGRVEAAEAVFRTSGTTRAERRGEHYLLDVTAYHAALLAGFAGYVLPDRAELPLLSLVPPGQQMTDSSLAHMVAVLVERVGAQGSAHYADVQRGIDDDALAAALRRFTDGRTPVCLLGTSLAFLHWLDRLRARGERFRLPAGSRLMDTGGFKGRRREVPAEELRSAYQELVGVPGSHVVNEYGMTELSSQAYDAGLRDWHAGVSGRSPRKLAPPWMRVLVADPETLEVARAGAVGILRLVDLANLSSVVAVQTEDLGGEVEDGFVVLGRATGAPPRGCSIAMDLLLSAVEERR